MLPVCETKADMQTLLIAVATYCIFTLQTAIAGSLSVAGCVPNLVFAGLLVLAPRLTGSQRLVTAAVWGLIADCLADGRLGPDLVCCTICILVVERCQTRWQPAAPLTLIVLAIPLTLFESAATATLRLALDGRNLEWQRLCLGTAGSAVWTVCVVALLAVAANLIGNRTHDRSPPDAPALSNKWRMLTE
jgi:rod shape-determining protein MreD